MRMSEKCHNKSNSDNPLTSHHTDGGKSRLIYSMLFTFSLCVEKKLPLNMIEVALYNNRRSYLGTDKAR